MTVREQRRFPILLSVFVYKMSAQFNYVSIKKVSILLPALDIFFPS